jgi:hypothetical protein
MCPKRGTKSLRHALPEVFFCASKSDVRLTCALFVKKRKQFGKKIRGPGEFSEFRGRHLNFLHPSGQHSSAAHHNFLPTVSGNSNIHLSIWGTFRIVKMLDPNHTSQLIQITEEYISTTGLNKDKRTGSRSFYREGLFSVRSVRF